MKFNIEKSFLLSTLSFAQGISEQHNTNSYYSFFILIAKKNTLIIKSADRQTTFEKEIEATEHNKLSIKEEGGILVHGAKTYNIISNIPDGIICFELNGEKNIVIEPLDNPNDIRYSIRTRDIEDFPNIHKEMPENKHTVLQKHFYKIINNTYFAALSDFRDPSMFLTGIFFETKENKFIAVATDRNRISISRIDCDFMLDIDDKENEDRDIIIPSKVIPFIKKLVDQKEEEITIAVSKERMFFKTNDIFISANLISGKYYDYKKVIPNPNRNKIIVNRESLKAALKRVGAIGDNRNAIIKMNVRENDLILSSEEKEQGEAQEKVPAKIQGKGRDFYLRLQFIVDPLMIMSSEEVQIEYGDEKRDLVKIVSIPDEETMHIVAPYNL